MDIAGSAKKYFTKQLTAWHATENDRSLPWKSEKDPYRIWLSEVILQQTRALQGLPYYLCFTDTYPTVADLAAARDEDVFRLWQGLGYYNRCKNLLGTARQITHELNAQFPDTYEGLLALKGIGPYTAAAIASFAYDHPHAVVDGNVFRVVSRYFGIDTPFDTTQGKRAFTAIANDLLDTGASAAYNQAIMDLGATVCTPRNPKCTTCPLQKKCMAYEHGLTDILPVRSKKQAVRTRYFNYLLLKWEGKLWVQRRTGKDIWQNLHQPYLIETEAPTDADDIVKHALFMQEHVKFKAVRSIGQSSQRLTHRIIDARFYEVELLKKPSITAENGQWLDAGELAKTAFPKTVVSFLENNYIL